MKENAIWKRPQPPSISDRTRVRISLLLTIISLILWTHSIFLARFEIGFWGLISSLPLTFFIALGILAVASALLWTSRQGHGGLLCLQLLILVTALWLVPAITGGHHPFTAFAYRNLGMTEYILSSGSFQVSKDYLSWPGSFLFLATWSHITSLNLESVLHFIPWLTQLAYLPPLFLFLKNTVGQQQPNYCWAGCWLFYLASWAGQAYLSPQGMAFFLFLLLLAIVTNPAAAQKHPRRFYMLTTSVIICATLVITHVLTALTVLALLILWSLIKKEKAMAIVAALCLILIIGWQLTGGGYFTDIVRSQPLLSEPTRPSAHSILTLEPGQLAENELTGRLAGSDSHRAVATTRLLYSGLFALIGLAGLIMRMVFRKQVKVPLLILATIMAPLPLIVFSSHYGGELLHRLYLFALPGMAYFGIGLLAIKSRVPVILICLLLVASIPLHIVSHYGNQEFDYFSRGTVSGIHFFEDNTASGYVNGGWPLGETRNIDRYLRIDENQVVWGNRLSLANYDFGQDLPLFIGISRQDRSSFEYLHDEIELLQEKEAIVDAAGNCNLFYVNPDFQIYMCEQP